MSEGEARSLSFETGAGRVSALFQRPNDARALFVLAHGAGAGMTHPFLEAVCTRLFDAGVATLRYQFPYTEAGRKRPDTPAVATATVRAAVDKASALAPDLPLLAGGKSFGGRMTSTAAADAPLSGVRGLVFLGFPLHAPGRRGITRARHLEEVGLPMLFLQGTRDPLADLELVRGVVDGLGDRATLHVVEGGDHSFRVLKRSGRSEEDVMEELQSAIAAWADGVLGAGGATR